MYNISLYNIRKNSTLKKMSTNKRYGPHNQMLISFLIGSLLGDGQARKGYNTKSGKGTIFTFSQGEKNKEYLL